MGPLVETRVWSLIQADKPWSQLMDLPLYLKVDGGDQKVTPNTRKKFIDKNHKLCPKIRKIFVVQNFI